MRKIIQSYYKTRLSFWDTFRTEWSSIKSDKAVVGTFISMAFIIVIVYAAIYSGEIVENAPVALIDQDFTATSRSYSEMLNSNQKVEVKAGYADLQEAKKALYSKEVRGIMIIPTGFEKDIRSNRQTSVVVYADASNMLFYKNIIGAASTSNAYFNGGIKLKKAMATGLSPQAAKEKISPIAVVSQGLFNISGGYATYIIPIVTALIIQLVILLAIGILSGTRREDNELRKNFPRILKTGGTIPILLGKAFLYFVIFAIIFPIQFGLIFYYFDIPIRSSILVIYTFLIPYILSVVFLGIVISSIFKKREDAVLFLVLASVPSLMLSGLSFPPEAFSTFHSFLSQLLPSTAGVTGFIKLSQLKASFHEVSTEWMHLWILSLVYFVMAAISLKVRARTEMKRATELA